MNVTIIPRKAIREMMKPAAEEIRSGKSEKAKTPLKASNDLSGIKPTIDVSFQPAQIPDTDRLSVDLGLMSQLHKRENND